jgi:hypothetical protein
MFYLKEDQLIMEVDMELMLFTITMEQQQLVQTMLTMPIMFSLKTI